jgi:hypothetical protein
MIAESDGNGASLAPAACAETGAPGVNATRATEKLLRAQVRLGDLDTVFTSHHLRFQLELMRNS